MDNRSFETRWSLNSSLEIAKSRQIVFLVKRQLFAFGLITDQHRRLVRSLHAQYVIEIRLIDRILYLPGDS